MWDVLCTLWVRWPVLPDPWSSDSATSRTTSGLFRPLTRASQIFAARRRDSLSTWPAGRYIGRYISVPRQLAYWQGGEYAENGDFLPDASWTRGCCDLEWWIGTQPNALCASDFQGGTVYVYSMLAFLGWIRLFDLSVYIGSGWLFQICVVFALKIGEDSHFDAHIFQRGLVQPATRDGLNPRHSKILWSGPGEGVGVSLEPLKIRTSGDVWRWTITDTDPHQVSGCPGKDQ